MPRTRSTVSAFGSIRQKPLLVVSSRLPSLGSTSSAFTYGGLLGEVDEPVRAGRGSGRALGGLAPTPGEQDGGEERGGAEPTPHRLMAKKTRTPLAQRNLSFVDEPKSVQR